ncbi:hypothetical protein [Umezawaea beigongshangensis]|uniref:hypothetical protein n=1 Tax=Umezawaea beigongshangensis TaxID=2780383 RepID=UPI0018F26674|nr:hypothetical protein [Umezawaea beigongshangensis]
MSPLPGRTGAALTVALLTAVAWGAWAWGGDGGDSSTPRGVVVTGDPRRPTIVSQADPVVLPPGEVVLDLSQKFQVVENARVLTGSEIELLEPHVRNVTAKVAADDGVTVGSWLFELRQNHDPVELVAGIERFYEDSDYQRLSSTPPGTSALLLEPPPGADGVVTCRGHYVSSSGVVRVEAYGTDSEHVVRTFAGALAAQLERLPQVL